MDTSKKNLGWLCFAWMFAILLGLGVGLNLPFILILIGTALYLFS